MNIATIGTGFIVDTFLEAVREIDQIQCVAMYSRKEETAKALAEKYQISAIYTDLDKMYTAADIDIVYIASPNSLHFDYVSRALNVGKHVICEKPFTSTVEEADRLIALAKQNNLMLFEGITTIHLPNFQIIKEQMEKLGEIKIVQCNYSQYSSRYNQLLAGETPNVFNPKFSGGALADINIYNLHFILGLFGEPEAVHYTANIHPNGIDTSGVAVMKYPGFVATCTGAKDTGSMNFVLIQGEKGYIHVVGGANGCKHIKLYVEDQEMEWNNQTGSNMLYYELLAFKEIFQTEDYERCYQLLDHSKSVMKVFEQARKDGGIVFAADEK